MTKTENLTFELDLNEIDKDAKLYLIEANSEQQKELVNRFKILELSDLQAKLSVSYDKHQKGVVVSGNLKADLVQQCVVTLGPVPEKIDEEFELLLVSPEQAAVLDEEELYADPEAPDYDAIEGNIVPLGEVVAQTLSVMMNPYPRVAGAEVKPVAGSNFTANEEVGKKPTPFAALAELRDKS